MAHKTLIEGTTYDIKGGKTLIDGTAYSVKGGKTLIDGTIHSINFGVEWKKYNCNANTYTSTQYYTSSQYVGNTGNLIYNSTSEWPTMYKYYAWSSSTGYYGTNGITQATPGYIVGSSGSYQVVYLLKSRSSSNSKWYYAYEIVASAYPSTSSYTTYSKGSTSYGTVIADEGSYPENGSLIEGGPTNSYCILYVGGAYYYYEKV